MLFTIRLKGGGLFMGAILVVDDDGVARTMAVTAIERMGHIAFASPHGRHAYETLKENDGIELVITDMMMPEMDGWQLIQTIREDAEFADLPIIAMSAVVESEEISKILELGANLFMRKPFAVEDMQQNVGKCLEGK